MEVSAIEQAVLDLNEQMQRRLGKMEETIALAMREKKANGM
jgi:hypothetical protein